MSKWMKAGLAAIVCLGCLSSAMAIDVPTAEWEAMKQKIAELQARGDAIPATSTMVDTAMDSKYGPNQTVSTKHGKLQVGLLMQSWYYNIQHDTKGFFNDPNVNGIQDNNSVQDGAGFRIRRTELTFRMDLNENITSVLMIDPAREAGGYPQFPSDQGNYKRGNQLAQAPGNGLVSNGTNSTGQAGFYQTGGLGSAEPRLLQNAYIVYHDFVPHHDFTIGQWKPNLGEEGVRDSAKLDFVERSMVGFQTDSRTGGVGVDGYWWQIDEPETGNETGSNVTHSAIKANNRIRYQFGAFNSDGSYFTPGDNQNRPNTNYSLDLSGSVTLRPIWDNCRGKLELGVSYMGGEKGKGDRGNDPVLNPQNDLNRPQHYAFRANAWALYRFGWILSGLWTEAEWTEIHDQELPNSVIDVLGTGGSAGADFTQNIGQPFTRQGFYVDGGYKLSESKICNLPCWLKPFEFAGRFERFQNIETANQVEPWKTDLFYTTVETVGINYYILSNNAKIQANYNFVSLPGDKSSPDRVFHSTKANSFVMNFQVCF